MQMPPRGAVLAEENGRRSDRLRGREYHRVLELLQVSAAVFADAVTVSERDDDQQLRFADATTVAFVQRHGTDRVSSFEDELDGVVRRTAPSAVSGGADD